MSILTVTASTKVVGRLSKLEKAIFGIHIGSPRIGKNPKRTAWEADYKNVTGEKPKELGHGSKATAYRHPTDSEKVIKVVFFEDQCWDEYLRISKRIRDKAVRKLTPKVYASAFNKDGTSIHIVERLYKATPARVRRSVKRDKYMWEVLQSIGMLIGFGMAYQLKPDSYFKDKHPVLSLINTLRKRCTLDIHIENIMFRKNGDMVLMDPVAGRLR